MSNKLLIGVIVLIGAGYAGVNYINSHQDPKWKEVILPVRDACFHEVADKLNEKTADLSWQHMQVDGKDPFTEDNYKAANDAANSAASDWYNHKSLNEAKANIKASDAKRAVSVAECIYTNLEDK
ncbi:TPA: hypothetical protein M2Q89_000686 [Escherichia coli]|nr:hypothetical protein [Escherichia coli]